jgi:hypothetical protein
MIQIGNLVRFKYNYRFLDAATQGIWLVVHEEVDVARGRILTLIKGCKRRRERFYKLEKISSSRQQEKL